MKSEEVNISGKECRLYVHPEAQYLLICSFSQWMNTTMNYWILRWGLLSCFQASCSLLQPLRSATGIVSSHHGLLLQCSVGNHLAMEQRTPWRLLQRRCCLCCLKGFLECLIVCSEAIHLPVCSPFGHLIKRTCSMALQQFLLQFGFLDGSIMLRTTIRKLEASTSVWATRRRKQGIGQWLKLVKLSENRKLF